jgi:hypothetical protein
MNNNNGISGALRYADDMRTIRVENPQNTANTQATQATHHPIVSMRRSQVPLSMHVPQQYASVLQQQNTANTQATHHPMVSMPPAPQQHASVSQQQNIAKKQTTRRHQGSMTWSQQPKIMRTIYEAPHFGLYYKNTVPILETKQKSNTQKNIVPVLETKQKSNTQKKIANYLASLRTKKLEVLFAILNNTDSKKLKELYAILNDANSKKLKELFDILNDANSTTMEETYCKRKGYTKLFPNDTQPSCASSTPKKSPSKPPSKSPSKSLPNVLNVKPAKSFTQQPTSKLSGWA